MYIVNIMYYICKWQERFISLYKGLYSVCVYTIEVTSGRVTDPQKGDALFMYLQRYTYIYIL